MELGLFVEPQVGGTYGELVELAAWSEVNGLDVFARSDHYLNMDASAPTTDALVAFGGVAAATNRIRLVTLVSPLTFRHPAVMAKSATTIDEISNGRFTLGVGTGWMETEHDAFGLRLPDVRERFERLDEALAYIRAVFDGGGTTLGEHYTLTAERIRPAASPGLKIVVGGGGPTKTPTLAGRYADEYNLFVTDRDSASDRRSVMRTAALEAGRSPDDILISFAGPCLVFASDAEYDAEIATRAAKREMSIDDYVEMLDTRHVPHGSPQQARDAIDRMADLGIGRYYVQEYMALAEIDLDRMERVFGALSGS